MAYARWLISFGMELEDKKVRPRGSPPREGVLADLAQQLCAFPAHAPACKFATFYRCLPPPPGFVKFSVCSLCDEHTGLLWCLHASGWQVHCSMLHGCCRSQRSCQLLLCICRFIVVYRLTILVLLRSARLAPQPPPAAGSEVYVVVMDRTGADAAGAALRIERCPAGCTRAELAERLASRALSPAHLRVLVRPHAGVRALS